MSNVRPVEERHARLYLHLAERFGWTPEQINELDPAGRVAMAKVLDLAPRDEAPAAENAATAPNEDQPLAEWERNLLAGQNAGITTTAPNVTEVHVYLDGKVIHTTSIGDADRVRQRLLNGNWPLA